MKKGALSRWKVGAWIVPLGLIAVSLTFQACGGDDGCADKSIESTSNACAQHALTFDCGPVDYSFDAADNSCSASNCRICPTNTPVRVGTPSPGQTPNTPVPLSGNCDLQTIINTPRPTPGVTPDLNSRCRDFAINKVCGSPNYSFEADTGLCLVSGCGLCNFGDDVF